MTRVRVLVEGQTEREFVKSVLKPRLDSSSVYLHALMFRPRGGVPEYTEAKDRIVHSLKEDNGLICTTMVDYYALPKAWPGREAANSCRTVQDKAKTIEAALLAEIQKQMGQSFNPARFIPYVQMHEFEALLFSDSVSLAGCLGEEGLAEVFQGIRNACTSPEEINDNFETCPSRRIGKVYPEFKKTIDGISAASQIGLNRMRQECPHFNEWITKLESLAE